MWHPHGNLSRNASTVRLRTASLQHAETRISCKSQPSHRTNQKGLASVNYGNSFWAALGYDHQESKTVYNCVYVYVSNCFEATSKRRKEACKQESTTRQASILPKELHHTSPSIRHAHIQLIFTRIQVQPRNKSYSYSNKQQKFVQVQSQFYPRQVPNQCRTEEYQVTTSYQKNSTTSSAEVVQAWSERSVRWLWSRNKLYCYNFVYEYITDMQEANKGSKQAKPKVFVHWFIHTTYSYERRSRNTSYTVNKEKTTYSKPTSHEQATKFWEPGNTFRVVSSTRHDSHSFG